MKKLIALILVLLLCSSAMAATVDWSSMTDDEINAEIAAAQAELESRGIAAEEPVEEGYQTLQKGSKGDDVKALQLRLIELNYLSGSADGDYGGKTASAVELFQSTVGLTATGVADADTQTALFAADAPKAKVYQTLDYKAISREHLLYVYVIVFNDS